VKYFDTARMTRQPNMHKRPITSSTTTTLKAAIISEYETFSIYALSSVMILHTLN
jgi:hypothetical protein